MFILCTYVCVTFSRKLLDHSVVLHLWECGPIVIGIPHHHPQLHRLSNLSAIWPFHHYVNMKLKGGDKERSSNLNHSCEFSFAKKLELHVICLLMYNSVWPGD